MSAWFADRRDAGRQLAARLDGYAESSPIVLGLPRGGVVVAAEVARRLQAPLDVIVVRKLGVPWQPELAMGAIGEGGVRVLDQRILADTGVRPDQIDAVEQQERENLSRRVELFRGSRSAVPLQGRTVIIVDDGIATGSTARAACQVAKAHGAAHVVLAAPVAPSGIEQEFVGVADRVVCLAAPLDFRAVGQFYDDFRQTTDKEVTRILAAERSP